MNKRTIAECFIVSGVALIISAFGNFITLVNTYNNYVENSSSHVVSAFDG